ncbi:hypothetical protein CspHIS471_0307590 [Cutaneotrichosporon sp. HIS471]|nr:hypothetical protein CspHIS471_0307590 [Cutaneotrichosporon sp. HIS471]
MSCKTFLALALSLALFAVANADDLVPKIDLVAPLQARAHLVDRQFSGGTTAVGPGSYDSGSGSAGSGSAGSGSSGSVGSAGSGSAGSAGSGSSGNSGSGNSGSGNSGSGSSGSSSSGSGSCRPGFVACGAGYGKSSCPTRMTCVANGCCPTGKKCIGSGGKQSGAVGLAPGLAAVLGAAVAWV